MVVCITLKVVLLQLLDLSSYFTAKTHVCQGVHNKDIGKLTYTLRQSTPLSSVVKVRPA